MSENIGALMDEYDEASREFRQTESKDSFKRKCNAYEAIAKTVYILESQLADAIAKRDALIERLVEAGDGLDSYVNYIIAAKSEVEKWRALVAEYRASKESVE